VNYHFDRNFVRFLHEHLHIDDSIKLTSDRIIITNGAIVVYSWVLADIIDVIIVPSSYYSCIDHTVSVVAENHHEMSNSSSNI
jgi:hypothetical protein